MKVSKKTLAAMQAVEAAHFRTECDTGANSNAMLVWNALRSELGLPLLTKADLYCWDDEKMAYVSNPKSNLIANLPKE